MDESLLGDELEHLERSSSLGYLLGSISHELNNHLTNLLLVPDQTEGGRALPVVQSMADQAQKAGAVVAMLQRLGTRNLSRGSEAVNLAGMCERLRIWLLNTAGEDVGEIIRGDTEVVVLAGRQNLLRALCNLSRVGAGADSQPLVVSVGIEQAPRSVWAPAGEQIAMAVVRLRRGTPPGELSPRFKALVDDFFSQDREVEEVALMAAWEVVRKLRGRLEMYGNDGTSGLEMVVKLPLVESRS